ncbi:tetratricopeptide repeat-containing sulfotransferase family protein [Teredinibacter turnerae]|uniref:tetratricopeptide repeat-containing sulfotransferase family protein n=1 Tax=Teredinibacter turnerae TaxID=2426 RepID=UPI0003780F8B|nr:tetratricopeptide repeat-containing sulfotransferase family protein [Teredinibacter turnerae]
MNTNLEQLHKSAIAALNRGDLRAVHNYCESILGAYPAHADAWFLLAMVAANTGKLQQALELIDKALSITPQVADYLAQKAKLLTMLRHDKAARTCADKAVALNPQGALLLDTLGVVYTNLGDYAQARELLNKAVALKPEHLQFRFNLATAEQFLGNLSVAKAHYLKAIEIKPTYARAFWALSELNKENLDGSQVSAMERLLEQKSLSTEDGLYLSHALSREYEQRGHYTKSFKCLQQAKTRRRQELGYSLEQDIAIFQQLQQAFAKLDLVSWGNNNLGESCIFIVGIPRSGTTLTERIISAHSAVESLGELQNFGLAVRRSVDTNSRLMLNSEIVKLALAVDAYKIGDSYLASVHQRRSQAPFFIDKMPLNFLYIGFIARCLPKAKIICVERNPMDVCLSNFRQLFALNFSYYNYHYDIEDTARYIIAFHQLMSFWKTQLPGRIHTVNYETLTEEPAKHIQELLSYCGLDWENACLNFHENTAAVATPSASQVREKLYKRAVGRWKHYEEQLAGVKDLFDQAGIKY